MMEGIVLAEAAARTAGRIIREASTKRIEVRHKGDVDLVTQVDVACEAAIRALLEQHTPDIEVLAEEGGGAWNATTRWIVDPLDGTTNFVHGYPSYGVSIALEIDGVMELGCIYDPIHDRAYTATRGGGAWCGKQRLHVSEVDELSQALLLTGFPYDRRERAKQLLAIIERFLHTAQGIRRAGAAAMDFVAVASGCADGFWEFGLQPWDVAAGALLVIEAGGQVTDMDLNPLDLGRRRTLVSNGRIHKAMGRVMSDLISSE